MAEKLEYSALRLVVKLECWAELSVYLSDEKKVVTTDLNSVLSLVVL